MWVSELTANVADVEARVAELLGRMTLEEKLGQTAQLNAAGGWVPDWLRGMVQAGMVGSVLNEVSVETANELQRIAVQESRLGIPLLLGRDVIHGFKTIFPIPLGQAATWNPDVVERGAQVAAREAAAHGVNWTFAPMLDICRDPRWGRVAEGLGEDPHLASVLGAAMVRGFQGDDLSTPGRIAACAKHFAGYGASESGRDYNTTNVTERDLRSIYLPPFRAALDAGCATVMTSFSDIDGVPASGNAFLLRQILREEWGFDGFVVSDWESVKQLAVHGLTADDRESAYEAATAGVDMEMVSRTYADHLGGLIHEGRLPMDVLDAMVANILRVKFRLGLFDDPYADPSRLPAIGCDEHLQAARHAATESVVLLKNEHDTLPLRRERVRRLAVVGPLADEPTEQLGTWIFDGDASLSVTPLRALREMLGDDAVSYARALPASWSKSREGFAEAVEQVREADAAVLFLGEDAILSGEAHCRAEITLPGVQEELIEALAETGTPLVLVVMAGRPLALERVIGKVQAVLYAWHPGTMAGPALADLLYGVATPSGKLPITLPRMTGQIPIYYAHKHTGKPGTPESYVHIDDLQRDTPQLSIGNTSFHFEAGFTPLFPFGHGLSYTWFDYSDIAVSTPRLVRSGTIEVSATMRNTGEREGEEVVQLYVRDPVASVTRPVRELKGFQRIRLAPGEERRVSFTLSTNDLAFHGRDMQLRTEPGWFHAWIGGSSAAWLHAAFEFVEDA